MAQQIIGKSYYLICIKRLLSAGSNGILGTLRNNDGNGNGNGNGNGDGNGNGKKQRQKEIGLVSKTKTLHVHRSRFFVHFFAVHARLRREMTKFEGFFFRGRERQGDKFYHLCLNSGVAPFLQFQTKFPSFK